MLIKYDQSPSLAQLLKVMSAPRPVILMSSKSIDLPTRLVEEIQESRSDLDHVRFEIRVNPALSSGVVIQRLNTAKAKAAYVLPQLVLNGYGSTKSLVLPKLKQILKESKRAKKMNRATENLASAQVIPQSTPENTSVQLAPAAGFIVTEGSHSQRFKKKIKKSLRTVDSTIREIVPTGHAVEPSSELRAYVLVHSLERLKQFAFPKYIHLALTKSCNLSCVMCPYHSEDIKKKHTTDYFTQAGGRFAPELLEKVLEEAGRYGASIGFGQYDEPFVYKNFTDYAVKAKKLGCSVSITTNGTLLSEDKARKLLEAGVEHISFSLDAASAETYKKIRGDDFSVPLANIKKLVSLRNEMKAKTSLRACLVLQEHNQHEVERFKQLMKSIGLDMISYYTLSKYEKGIWFQETLNFDMEKPRENKRYACSQLWSQVAIYPDGNVALCCATTMYVGFRDDVPYVGNVKDASLREIWFSSNYKKIRQEALGGIFENSVCRDCQIWCNFQNRTSTDKEGHMVEQNPYETFVYLRPLPS